MTRAPQLSGRRHIFVTPVAAVSLLRFSTCAFVCPHISCFCLDPGFFVKHFHAPISKACRDTLPSNQSFLLEYLEQLPYKSDRDDDEFEGYFGPDDGLVIIRGFDSAGYEVQEPHSSLWLPFAGRHGQGFRVSVPKLILAPPSPPCTLAPWLQLTA